MTARTIIERALSYLYTYDNGTVFMDLVNEYEKVGDYVLNVAEARLGL